MVQRGKYLQWLFWWGWGCCLPLLIVAFGSDGGNVSYDGRSLIIDGQHRILFSGSIHYPRSTPEMWPSIIAKAKEGGLDVIQTYVFWNLHEVRPGEYRFDGRRNLVRFIKAVQAQGLYVCLRIGPFIESEWTYGGLPFWLHDIPDIIYRTDNEPFKFYMERFTTKIVDMMKSENLFASQGGPIILSQIENEYSLVEGTFREQGIAYIHWAAQMAVGLQTGVPWIMCRQDDAPDPVINTCNNLHCGDLWSGPNSPNKPSMWTENWTSFYQVYGEEPTIRQAEDIAFNVALFIAKNGSYVNYYMYHGGTNFGRSASAFVTTNYYDQAPIDEYGLNRQPTWGHLKELHAAIKLCLEPLLSATQKIISLGEQQEAYVFSGNSGKCAAFLVNRNLGLTSVVFQNVSYELPEKSVSILPDCQTVAFNTAMVHAPRSTRSMTPIVNFDSTEKWLIYKEPVSNFDDTSIRADTLLEHMNTTKDISDYLWYTFRYQLDSPNTQSVLSVQSHGHVLLAFVNGALAGSAHGSYRMPNFTFENSVTLINGANNISLLSATVGLPDAGAYLEHKTLGLQRVMLQDQDFSNYSWGYQVGLWGENLKVYSIVGSTMIQWEQFNSSTQPLTWYKTLFDAPVGDDPIALNLNSMGKGQVWVNGQSIGRYWVSFHTPNGTSSQTWYNVPRSFLNSTGNLLVILEEESGNPLGVSLDVVSSR